MKIYILRHEDRVSDCSFFAPLTEKGLENANLLNKILHECNINVIIASPFIRTLQTIYPHACKNNKLINLEYGLSEIHNKDIIAKKSVGLKLPDYLFKSFKCNPNYKSFINYNAIKYPEIIDDVVSRIKKILTQVFHKYGKSDLNILLVTHQSLCASVLEIVNKYIKIDSNMLTNYPLGKLCLVYNQDWTYKLIN